MEEIKKEEPKQETPVVDEVIPKILIGVPILAWTHEFATSFLKFWTELMTYQHKGRKFHIAYGFKYRRPVHLAEQELADDAIAAGCTHLLLMDDDIYDVSVQDFLNLLDANKDVVGGVMHASGFPYAMCAFRRYETDKKLEEQPILKGPLRLYEIPVEQRKGLQKADLIPFGFTMIKTSVFSKFPKPWFNGIGIAPTDSCFADQILGAGLEYYADFDVWLNHRGITKDNVGFWIQMAMQDLQKKKTGMIVLTPEEMARHEVFMRIKLQEAEDKAKALVGSEIKFMEKDEKKLLAVPVEVPKLVVPAGVA